MTLQVEDLKTLPNDSPLSTPLLSPVKKAEKPKKTGIMNLPMPPGWCFFFIRVLISLRITCYALLISIYFMSGYIICLRNNLNENCLGFEQTREHQINKLFYIEYLMFSDTRFRRIEW